MKKMIPSDEARDFIDDAELERLLLRSPADRRRIREILAKSLSKQALSVEETACLLNVSDPEMLHEIFEAARDLKRTVYGNRIVLFAPLYIGNDCVNNCVYCGFRRSNQKAVRRTLSEEEIIGQVKALEDDGHKRLILVFGEHPAYGPEFIAGAVETVYETQSGTGEIRRVNINAAPLDSIGFGIVKKSGIGTYQIFQETYHHETYARAHPRGTRKADYLYRLDGVSRAIDAGCDDVGIGALFGLYDWRFEALGLVSHALFLQERHGVGPHTISFPRLRPACGVKLSPEYDDHKVSDDDFKKLIAIIRLAVPYTGMILTAREPPELRRELLSFGISQIDAGSRIELGGYTDRNDGQCLDRAQFELGDVRSLDEVMRELIADGCIPSFCTACYRLGRTGEHFMEFAIPGFIKRFCTPNALATLMEYLVDYGTAETREAGMKLIEREMARMEGGSIKKKLRERLRLISETGARDLYF